MKFLAILFGIFLGAKARPLRGARTYDFAPYTASELLDGKIAALYNLTDSQTIIGTNNASGPSSYWSSSFLTGSNKHQYLVVSHTLALDFQPRYFRGSILDITQPEFYWQRLVYLNDSTSYPQVFNISGPGYGFQALSTDQVSKLRTWFTNPDVSYNLTVGATAPVLLNGGTGSFTWGNGLQSEWGMTGGRTTGNLMINGTEIDIIPELSRTWYDRQWGPGSPSTGNWTWFELHFQNPDMKASVWAVDNATPYQRARFATVRAADGSHHILPMTITANTQDMFTSNATGISYPLEWNVSFSNGDSVTVKSVRPDQEIVGTMAIGDTAYEGFVTSSGRLLGEKVEGFGVVEMAHLS